MTVEQASACYPYPAHHPHPYSVDPSQPNYYQPAIGMHPPMAIHTDSMGGPQLGSGANACTDACCFYHPSMTTHQFYGETDAVRQVNVVGERQQEQQQQQQQQEAVLQTWK